ncbi:DUF6966 domain-containing protein [Roseobacter sp. HKCCA0434]|uniref:DUF6966 domain-containing protein n=1 Tax=Roseobacter sp. HKCCA0434 TaxID=3079297 RepID=UPI00396773C9
MKNLPMHPDLLKLIASLSRILCILDRYDEPFWFDRIAKVKRIAENSDGHSIELFLSFYRGMGSFNDLVLRAPNSANDMLYKERIRAYELARKLR